MGTQPKQSTNPSPIRDGGEPAAPGHRDLAYETAALLAASDQERISFIRRKRWIPYKRAVEILEMMEDLLQEEPSDRMPCFLLIGETGAGKTTIMRRFQEAHRPDDNLHGDAAIIPVLYVRCPNSADITLLYQAILENTFTPFKPSDREKTLKPQVRKVLREVGLKVLLLDELQHALVGSKKGTRAFLNELKNLVGELRVSIVGVGIRGAELAMRSDPQLNSRFETETLERWGNNDDFKRLLASFERWLPLREASHLPQLSADLRRISEGWISDLDLVLQRAAIRAIQTGKERIDAQILKSIRFTPRSQRRGGQFPKGSDGNRGTSKDKGDKD